MRAQSLQSCPTLREVLCSFLIQYPPVSYGCSTCVLSHFSRPTLCDPMDCSPPGSSVHGILQSRILEWVVMLSSRGSSQPRYRTCVSCTVGRFFSTEPPGKPHDCSTNSRKWTLVHTMCANSFVIFISPLPRATESSITMEICLVCWS